MSDIVNAANRAKKGKRDIYSNVAFGTCTLSAINTLTFSQIQMAVGLFQGVAMVIHRILWDPTAATLRELVAATDSLSMALCTTNRLTSIADLTDPSIIAKKQIVCVAANTEPITRPIVDDFTNLPGGGKLISANPIFFGMTSGGFGGTAVAYVQLDFTFVELSSADYLELVQAQFPANIS